MVADGHYDGKWASCPMGIIFLVAKCHYASAMADDTRDKNKFVIRMPDGLRDRIAEIARQNSRSMNAEIVMVLENHFFGRRRNIEETLTDLEREIDEIGDGRYAGREYKALLRLSTLQDQVNRVYPALSEDQKRRAAEAFGKAGAMLDLAELETRQRTLERMRPDFVAAMRDELTSIKERSDELLTRFEATFPEIIHQEPRRTFRSKVGGYHRPKALGEGDGQEEAGGATPLPASGKRHIDVGDK